MDQQNQKLRNLMNMLHSTNKKADDKSNGLYDSNLSQIMEKVELKIREDLKLMLEEEVAPIKEELNQQKNENEDQECSLNVLASTLTTKFNDLQNEIVETKNLVKSVSDNYKLKFDDLEMKFNEMVKKSPSVESRDVFTRSKSLTSQPRQPVNRINKV